MTEQQNSSGIGCVKSPLSARNLPFFCYPIKHNENPLISSPVSEHPLHFTLVSAYRNNSRKRTALITETFFNSRGCPLTRELTVLVFSPGHKCSDTRFTAVQRVNVARAVYQACWMTKDTMQHVERC